MPNAELITKAEFARRVGVSASMVSRYVAKGMPTAAGGRLNWHEAKRWRDSYVVPELSGSYHARQRQQQQQRRQPVQTEPTARALFETLMANGSKIPELLLETGLIQDIDLVRIATNVFADLVVVLGGNVIDEIYGEDDYLTMPGIDDSDDQYELLAITHDLPEPDSKRVDEVLDKVCAVIYGD